MYLWKTLTKEKCSEKKINNFTLPLAMINYFY